ncbi:MAG: recombinase family protein, partial [Chloroflexota bacterium]|nr:recombinase family protein [Chloroflexota bacterium]
EKKSLLSEIGDEQMMKQAALYARVSDPNSQDTKNSVSIDQQLTTQRELCKQNGWQIVGEFVDREYYKATQPPKRGKMVNPSGERADRPEFLKMLKVIEAGDADAVMCWRDDRLVRHPRVAVALEDALDIGDAQRNGKGKIEIRDATGAMIDRFTLSIKATIWREENKRRAERTRMGKIATLEQGHWPGRYGRYGYKTRKAERGRIIEIDESEAKVVREIHRLLDSGASRGKIRCILMAQGAPQKNNDNKHTWCKNVIYRILTAEDYTGKATWNFGDGTSISIEIPAIIPRELWERNQARIKRNKKFSARNSKGIYLLYGLLRCGECGQRMYAHRPGKTTKKNGAAYTYFCSGAADYPDEAHPRPYHHYGPTLDWEVWRRVVDYGIKRPDLIREQVLKRQAELQAQGDNVDGEIEHARQKLVEVDKERAFCLRQAKKGKITEAEFTTAMNETEDTHRYWQSELERLEELRDDAEKVQVGLDYATELLTKLQTVLPEIDIPPSELKKLSEDERNEILRRRQEIIRALVDCVEIYADKRVKIEGLLDGSEAARFAYTTLQTSHFAL